VPFAAAVLMVLAVALGPPPAAAPSRAAGQPWHGHLVRGVELPAYGRGLATWDPVRKRVGNRSWRRWGTARLVNTVAHVLAVYADRHPAAPPVLVGDLSRPHGGDFGKQFGGLGHASHQNGLDADVYYPRRDGRLRRAA
jgi:murein endopeptidase